MFTRLLSPLLAALLLSATPAPVLAETPEFYEQVYLTPDQALKVALPPHDKVEKRVVTPTAEQRQAAQRALGRKLEEPSFTFYEGYKGGKLVGTALMLDELGKHYPISFVVGLRPDGSVGEVAVMTYREKRGDAVRRRRFLNQFEGKTKDDPIRINRDIVHLTGSTISSWSIAAGVKKAVVLHDLLLKPTRKAP